MANITKKLKDWLVAKTESRKHISPLFSDALERDLTLTERLRVRIHLFTCSACLNYVTNLKFMQEAFRNHDEQNQGSLSDDARSRIKTAIRSAKSIVIVALAINLTL